MAINREMQGALVDAPEVFSRQCAQALLVIKCRICDPEVGQDKKPSVCPSLCSSWLDSCKSDYFGFSFNGDLVPCTTLSSSRILVCSRLDQLLIEQWEDKGLRFRPELELCKLAGLQIASSPNDLCYDGSSSSISPSACEDAQVVVQPQRQGDREGLGGTFVGPIATAAACVALTLAIRWGLTRKGKRKTLPRGKGGGVESSGLTDDEKQAITRAVEARLVQVEKRNRS